MIQSPLLTSLMALCIFSLFSLVMLGQRYTTPIVTVVCPVTNLHHMASILLFLAPEGGMPSTALCLLFQGIKIEGMTLHNKFNNLSL